MKLQLRLSGVLLACLRTEQATGSRSETRPPHCGTMATMTGTVSGSAGLVRPQPQALVYRGPEACPGCPEAVGLLLESSPSKFRVTYAGPDEEVDITADSLRETDVYAQPGGPGTCICGVCPVSIGKLHCNYEHSSSIQCLQHKDLQQRAYWLH